MAVALAERRFSRKAHEVECVYIPKPTRHALRLLAGRLHADTARSATPVPSGWCATSRGQIAGQVMVRGSAQRLGRSRHAGGGRLVTNIVMMGMGEPLYNFEAVRDALLIVATMRHRHLAPPHHGCRPRAWCRTSSARDPPAHPPASPVARFRCMRCATVAQRAGAAEPQIPIAELLQAPRLSRRPRTRGASPSNIVMLKGVNDRWMNAKLLVKLLKGFREDQPHSIQFRAGTAYEFRIGTDREILRVHLQRRLFPRRCARRAPRHSRACGQLKSETENCRRAKTPGAARHGDDGLNKYLVPDRHGRACPASTTSKTIVTKQDVDARHEAGHDDGETDVPGIR